MQYYRKYNNETILFSHIIINERDNELTKSFPDLTKEPSEEERKLGLGLGGGGGGALGSQRVVDEAPTAGSLPRGGRELPRSPNRGVGHGSRVRGEGPGNLGPHNFPQPQPLCNPCLFPHY